MKVNFLISDEFYKDDQTFIISNDGSATGSGLMKWFSPFSWRNTLYVVDYNANIHRLNNKSKLKLESILKLVACRELILYNQG